jgi:hypothetical protein
MCQAYLLEMWEHVVDASIVVNEMSTSSINFSYVMLGFFIVVSFLLACNVTYKISFGQLYYKLIEEQQHFNSTN